MVIQFGLTLSIRYPFDSSNKMISDELCKESQRFVRDAVAEPDILTARGNLPGKEDWLIPLMRALANIRLFPAPSTD